MPMTWGYHLAGMLLSKLGYVKSSIPTSEHITDMIKSAAIAFTPFGETGNLTDLITPELLEPLVHVANNKDWKGHRSTMIPNIRRVRLLRTVAVAPAKVGRRRQRVSIRSLAERPIHPGFSMHTPRASEGSPTSCLGRRSALAWRSEPAPRRSPMAKLQSRPKHRSLACSAASTTTRRIRLPTPKLDAKPKRKGCDRQS
jgi:hypothetical protein